MVKLYTSISLPNEPKTYIEAQLSGDFLNWEEAMATEIKSLEDCKTWEVINHPKNTPVVSCKWVYKLKLIAAGEIARYKA